MSHVQNVRLQLIHITRDVFDNRYLLIAVGANIVCSAAAWSPVPLSCTVLQDAVFLLPYFIKFGINLVIISKKGCHFL